MNMQVINKWIMIDKRIIRSSKRENRNERQNKLTKYFNLQPSVNPIKITPPKFIEKCENYIKLQCITFYRWHQLPPK